MALKSDYKPLVKVFLPYQGRQVYMQAFDLSNPELPENLKDYEPIIKSLCEASGYNEGIAYLTVDEKVVEKGKTQRKPKAHVDGCFTGSSWGHGGGWLHYCNEVPVPRMSVIVASSVPGCKAWRGEFDGTPKSDGDLSHIEHLLGEGEVLPANFGYLLSPDCVHESLPMDETTERTFIRIALPVE